VIWARDGTKSREIPGLVFTNGLDRVVGIREWQVEQVASDQIIVRLEPLPGGRFDPAVAEQSLTHGLRVASFPESVGVSVVVVAALRNGASISVVFIDAVIA